jgi:hypothetical protein
MAGIEFAWLALDDFRLPGELFKMRTGEEDFSNRQTGWAGGIVGA